MKNRVAALILVFSAAVPTANGEVVRIAVEERGEVASGARYGLAGGYEKLRGRIDFEIDPDAPVNAAVADIGLAPTGPDGRVAFSADFFVLKPKRAARGNGTILLEVSNRGGKGMLQMLSRAAPSRDPETAAELGDGFLLRNGFTLLWVGWQLDVPDGDDVLGVGVPRAGGRGAPVRGLVRSDFVVRERVEHHSLADRNMVAYPVADPGAETSVLTVRDAPLDEREIVPREQWRFARVDGGRVVDDPTYVHLDGGFEPNRIYEVIYEAENPPLAGLGLAAVRDAVSHLKHEAVPELGLDAGDLERAIAFGISQSGRMLRTFLYDGFNEDERQRKVFDGVMPHIAGGARGSFNHRFAQPSRASWSFFYPNAVFPFADTELADDVTGARDGLLARIDPRFMPKVLYTNSSNEYWRGSAALTHVTPDGRTDIELMDDVRMYFFAGTQHVPAAFPPPEGAGQQPHNPNDYGGFLRALLLELNDWVETGDPPPESRYPTLRDGTLTAFEDLRFPGIPGVNVPQAIAPVYRVDHGVDFASTRIPTLEPPQVGAAYPLLVPQVDSDGNEVAGLAAPEVAVPLGTYTGWSLYRTPFGPEDELVSLQGSYVPFARTRAERETRGDPRPSIEERYPSREHYIGLVAEHASMLVEQGYLVAEDLPWVVERAAERWEHATGGSAPSSR